MTIDTATHTANGSASRYLVPTEITPPRRRHRARSGPAAQRHPFAAIARSLSDVFPRSAGADDPVQIAFLPLAGASLHQMLAFQASPTEIERRVGVRAAHLPAIAKEATHQDSAIGIRFVEPAASKLIAQGHHTKNLSVKGKSSNWGPMRGFVPIEQALSKLALRHPERVDAANQSIHAMLLKERHAARDNYQGIENEEGQRMQIVAAPLTLSAHAFKGQCAALDITDHLDEIAFSDAAMPNVQFLGRRRGAQWTFGYARPGHAYLSLAVVAYQDRDGRGVLRGAPRLVTADYDLLFLMPSIRAHGSKDNRPVPLVNAENYRAYSGRASDDDASVAARDRVLLDLHKPFMGNASFRVEELVARMSRSFPVECEAPRNTSPPIDIGCLPESQKAYSCGIGLARPLIHHSDDLANPFSDAGANYPALIILPKSLSHYVRNAARGMVAEGAYSREQLAIAANRNAALRIAASNRLIAGECPLALDAAPYFVVDNHAEFRTLYHLLRHVLHFVGAPNPLWRV